MPQDWDGDGLLAPVSCLFSAAKAGFRSAVNRHDSSRALIQNWPSILLLRYLRIELLVAGMRQVAPLIPGTDFVFDFFRGLFKDQSFLGPL